VLRSLSSGAATNCRIAAKASALLSRPRNDAIIDGCLIGYENRLVKKSPLVASLLQVFFLLLLLSCSGHTIIAHDSSGIVELLSIELDPSHPETKEFGSLTLLSAYQLRSKDRRFGGLSGLSFDPTGHLYAVSDRGYWLSARISLDSNDRLVDLLDWRIKPLLTPEMTPVDGALNDAEALARAPDGALIVAFEQIHRLWRYPPPPATFDSPPAALPIPAEIAKAPTNGAIEAITYLPDGRLLILTEEHQNPDGSFKGWLLQDGRFAEVSYLPSDGFHVTDCAGLKNGDVLVLERYFGFFGSLSARIKLVRGRSLRPGARIAGEEILRLDSPLAVDNFEALAVQEDSVKGTVVYLASDDNFLFFQRTLLLQFRLNDKAA
jgi:hypothetical protein